MKKIYFISLSRRSMTTIRIEYGQVKKNFASHFEGEINGRAFS